MKECTFGNNICNISDFYWSYDEQYGHCFTFISHMKGGFQRGEEQDIIFLEKTEKDAGLSLILDADIYRSATEVVGFRMLVHDNKERPFPADNAVMVSPGLHTFVGVNRREVKPVKSPFGDCEDMDHKQHKQKSYFADKYAYSRSACLKSCRQMRMMIFCNCCLYVLYIPM